MPSGYQGRVVRLKALDLIATSKQRSCVLASDKVASVFLIYPPNHPDREIIMAPC